MNTGPCIGGPLEGLGTFSRESDTLVARVVSFEGGDPGEQPPFTETRYYWRDGSPNPPWGPQLRPHPDGFWIWENHQERDDLPAERN